MVKKKKGKYSHTSATPLHKPSSLARELPFKTQVCVILQTCTVTVWQFCGMPQAQMLALGTTDLGKAPEAAPSARAPVGAHTSWLSTPLARVPISHDALPQPLGQASCSRPRKNQWHSTGLFLSSSSQAAPLPFFFPAIREYHFIKITIHP